MSFGAPELITAAHSVSDFDCGKEALNLYLKRFALTNTAAGCARSFVVCPTGTQRVIGYYSLAAGAVELAHVPERVAKGLPKHPVSVVLLARLAADRTFHGQGLGKELLRDALFRSLAAAERIGIRAVLVHAKDEAAARFYTHYGFSPSPTDSLHLLLLIKDIRQTLR